MAPNRSTVLTVPCWYDVALFRHLGLVKCPPAPEANVTFNVNGLRGSVPGGRQRSRSCDDELNKSPEEQK